MKPCLKFLKQRAVPLTIVSAFYLILLMILILVKNQDSQILYAISPYEYASGIIDFFFSLLVSLPFSYFIFFMKKDHFLDYASLRIKRSKYIAACFAANLILCFLMVFLVNSIGVIFSARIANVITINDARTLADYPLGLMQMNAPIAFGFLWSAYKGFIGTLICLFAQIIALYVDNLFLALCLPFVYVALENFLTGILQIPQYSLTTAFNLNRLKPAVMTVSNLAIGITIFIAVILVTWIILRGRYEKNR